MLSAARNAMTAVLLSSVAVAPIATLTVVASVDAAHAKSENSKGNGKGASKRHGGDSDVIFQKGKGSGKSASRGGGNSNRGLKGLGDDLRGMGREMKGLFTGEKPNKGKAKKKVARASGEVETDGPETEHFVRGNSGKSSAFHPSELGNMNGAMNASMNAVLAHIRNGNTNGPVGAMAMLATAKAAAEETGAYGELDAALRAGGYDSLADFEKSYAPDPDGVPSEEDAAILAALKNLEAEYNEETGYQVDEDELAKATAAGNSLEEAEQNLLSMWNKNPGEVDVVEGELTPQEKLLEEAHGRFLDYGDAIDEAIAEGAARDAAKGSDGDEGEEFVEDCIDDTSCENEEDMALVD